MKLIKELGLESYWMINKSICRKIGAIESLILQHFIDLQFKLFGGKEFFQQQERIMNEFGLTEHQVRKTIQTLEKLGLINIVKKGLPAKYFYSINEDEVIKLLGTSTESDSDKINSNEVEDSKTTTTTTKVKKVREIKEKEVNLSGVINDYLNEPEPISNNDDSLNEEIDIDELDFGKYNNI
jgi:hypothetical protein